MPDSITAAQKDLLNSSFDFQGSDRSGIVLKNTSNTLIRMAGVLVSDVQKNLVKADRVSSGLLSASFKIIDPRVINGVVIKVDIEALDYYTFIDAGVKGTKSGTSSKGYKYTTKGPPINEIRKWLIKEGIKGRQDKKYKLGGRDTRRKSITETSNSVAAAISGAIKRKGLKQTNFLTKAVEKVQAKSKDELGKAFKIDIIASLPTKL